MSSDPNDTSLDLQRLLKCLGYTREAGWIAALQFSELTAHRFPMQQAQREMSVVGAFCLTSGTRTSEEIATPIVYVANASDLTSAQEIHRRVWSQGLAPFLLIAIPEGVVLCPGFSYAHHGWQQLVRLFTWLETKSLPTLHTTIDTFVDPAASLWELRSTRLRTSLFWRDHAVDVSNRVDHRLLANLDALSDVLIRGAGVSRKISPTAANGLIGRFLYTFCLADRGIIDQHWVNMRRHKAIDLSQQDANWTPAATWAFFDDLDSIFNGSIFPIGRSERAEIDGSHINLVRRVMKHGAQADSSGALQLSFLDFYLGALRTETLSAVYEQFLENIRTGERRRVGAFYTPPFLVDFILDRLEEVCPLQDGITILDPAAGSGVFLVGSYRRLVEKTRLGKRAESLDIETLRGLLLRNIFGIERNRDACHVAAFSLYLTMLDYVDPRDLTRIAAGQSPTKLFPKLLNQNLYPDDFFAPKERFKGLPDKVHCIVGNPPWQTLDKLESSEANDWREEHGSQFPIGKNQAAELFTWKAIAKHLVPDGVLAFLLPAKSFINPTSWNFRRELASKFTVVGAANFAHFRYRLFASARQAVVAAFVRNRPPSPRDRMWIYSPLSVTQPMARKAWPWTFLLDRSDIQIFYHDHIARDPRGWFEAFMLRPVDRQVRQFLCDSAAEKSISLLQDLCDAVGAAIRRGGNASETGVDRAYLIDAPNQPLTSEELLQEHDGKLFKAERSVEDPILPRHQLAKVADSYRHRFGGNVLLVPRNFSNVRFVDHPIGYTSSTLGVFFDKPARKVTEREKKLLKAIGAYLRSPIALYLVATIGRRWLMDRRNIEPTDLAAFPVPFIGAEDTRIDEVLSRSGAALERYLLTALGLRGDFERAIQEFLAFRIGFQDGDVPAKALSMPMHNTVQRYEHVLTRNLNGLIGRDGAFAVRTQLDEAIGVGAVAVQFVEALGNKSSRDVATAMCEAALASYENSSANSFSNSLGLAHDKSTSTATFLKPLEFFRWTVDSAFADSRQMMSVLLAGKH